MSSDYAIKRISNSLFRITKFDGHDIPTEQYETIYDIVNKKMRCECYGFRFDRSENHKHFKLIRQFIADGEPMMKLYELEEK